MLAAGVVFLGIKADADAGAGSAAPARPLVGGGLRDGFYLQALDARAVDEARNARQAGVDDEPDARDGDRGLGDVGGEDYLAPWRWLEHALLLSGGQGGHQRQDFVVGRYGVACSEGLGRLADVALAGEEGQDVALGRERFDGAENLVGEVCVAGVLWREVADFNGVALAWNFDNWRAVEEVGEQFDVQSRG